MRAYAPVLALCLWGTAVGLMQLLCATGLTQALLLALPVAAGAANLPDRQSPRQEVAGHYLFSLMCSVLAMTSGLALCVLASLLSHGDVSDNIGMTLILSGAGTLALAIVLPVSCRLGSRYAHKALFTLILAPVLIGALVHRMDVGAALPTPSKSAVIYVLTLAALGVSYLVTLSGDPTSNHVHG